MRRVKGFTLVELIVVIAIIGILAVILVPSMMGYVKNARTREYNSNARSVYSGAQLAIVDMNNAGETVPANCIFIGASDGMAYSADGNYEFSLSDYLGENFEGYFAFLTDANGYGCVYALWSNEQIPVDSVVQLSETQVKNNINSALPIGCHPLLPMNAAEDDN